MMLPWHWIGFFALILILLALDLGVFHREAHKVRTTEAMGWTGFWIALGLSFSGLVYLIYENGWFDIAEGRAVSGTQATLDYLTAYLVEKSLSIDNIFVISLVFKSLAIEPRYQHRVLFWGIVGALVMRASIIAGGVWLIAHFTWTFYLFGAILVFSGAKMFFEKEKNDHEEAWVITTARRILPVAHERHGQRMLVREKGKRVFTPLAIALIAVEITDIIFAVDSVPAVLAVSTDPFIVVTSNVFAILGLRSLYFVLANMIDKFRHLKYALALLLVLIGGKLIAHDIFHVPNWVSLLLVLVIVSGGILYSLAAAGSSDPPAPSEDGGEA